MKRIKKKPPTFSKIRNERGEITSNVTEILDEKRKYFHKLYSKPMQTAEEAEEEKEILTQFHTDQDSRTLLDRKRCQY